MLALGVSDCIRQKPGGERKKIDIQSNTYELPIYDALTFLAKRLTTDRVCCLVYFDEIMSLLLRTLTVTHFAKILPQDSIGTRAR
jgi:hypothetical protein